MSGSASGLCEERWWLLGIAAGTPAAKVGLMLLRPWRPRVLCRSLEVLALRLVLPIMAASDRGATALSPAWRALPPVW